MFLNLLSASGEQQTTPWTTWVGFILIAAVIIGLVVWNYFANKKRAKENQDSIDNMKIGDKIKTIGGICGFLVAMDEEENTFILETGYGDKTCYIKFDKGAIYQTAPANPEVVEEAEPESKVEITRIRKEEKPAEPEEVKEEPAVEEPVIEETEAPKKAKKSKAKKQD